MRLLRSAVLIAIAGLLPLVVAGSAGASSDTYIDPIYGSIPFHPFTIDAPTGTCPTWADGTEATKNCDPVNLVFPGRTPQQVWSALRPKGWSVWGWGSLQSMHFGTVTQYPQDLQLFRADGPGLQYHVRLWQVRGIAGVVTVGAVHHERTAGFTHQIDMAWEQAEAFLAGQLCAGAGVSCANTAVLAQQQVIQARDFEGDQNPGTWRWWANDLRATIIRLGP